MPSGLEAAQHPCGVPAFALARRLVRILRSIVQPPVATMLNARHDLLLGCSVTSKLVRNEDTWHTLATFEQFTEERLGRPFVPSALNEDIQDVAILIYRTPEVRNLAIDRQKHFVK